MLDLRQRSLGLRRARNPGQEKYWQDLVEWLYEAIPAIVMRWMLVAKAVKVCSGISPVFASIASANGFDAWVEKVPGHVFNVVRLNDCDAVVDLSAIQFEYNAEADDGTFDFVEAETKRLLDEVRRNPFRAAKVIRVEKSEYRHRDLEAPYDAPSVLKDYARSLKDFAAFRSGKQMPDYKLDFYGGFVGEKTQPTSAGLPPQNPASLNSRVNPRRLGRQ